MRLSPFLIFFLTASTTLGTAYPSWGNDPSSPQDENGDFLNLTELGKVTQKNQKSTPTTTSSLDHWLTVTPEDFATAIALDSQSQPLPFAQGTTFVQGQPLVSATETVPIDNVATWEEPDLDLSQATPTSVAFQDNSQLLSPSSANPTSPASLPNDSLAQNVPTPPPTDTDNDLSLPDFDTPSETSQPGDSPLGDPIPSQPESEPQVLVAEVVVEGENLTPELESLVYNTIDTQPGRTTTRAQLQEDVNAVFATGYFSNVRQVPEDTPLGVRITFVVDVNPVLEEVVVQTIPENAEQVIPQSQVEQIFGENYGEVLNLRDLQEDVVELNEWYQQEGYDLAQVVGSPQVSDNGVVQLTVAEGVIEDLEVTFFNTEDQEVDGRTREFIITREMQLEPGTVFNRETAQADLQRVFGLGLFEDARLSFSPGENPAQVVVNVEVIEGSTGSLAAGAGVSSASGFFGTLSYQQQNVGGNDQDLTAEVQVGTRDFLFDISFTDPWIAGDPYRTSYTLNAFRRQSISLIFDEGDPEPGEDEIRLPNGDRPRVVRTGGGITFTRPLVDDPFSQPEWTLSAGFRYQGVEIRDSDGNISPRDELGNLLSFNPNGQDTLTMLQFGAVRDRRNSVLQPTTGSLLRLSVDQTLPIGAGQITFSRLRGSYSYYLPVDWVNFTEDPDAAETLAFNLQAGTILGDLPPYEAFSIGGSNSVRGYEEGDVGSGRSYFQATAEYRFPIFSFINGALFVDYGTDLGTGDNVPGNPAGVRGKPGDGLGYGVGVRIQSPLNPNRAEGRL
ncbi:MAG: BamA/TamA family outer membrane protein, partial [Kamptonema sp. SIO4C4]|nr:BamA/TamA family outer membrane protein [Kamptonema sp. SIO4C4]